VPDVTLHKYVYGLYSYELVGPVYVFREFGQTEAGPVIEHGSFRITVTVKPQSAVFPELSVALHVTLVTPVLKDCPLSVVPVPVVAPVKIYTKLASPQLSEAAAFQSVPEWV
jgi:hypothetical protein